MKEGIYMLARIEKLRDAMRKEALQGMLVTSPANLRYLTNFTGTAGLALITLEKAYFITDFRYVQQAEDQTEGFEIIQNSGPIFEELTDLEKESGIENVGFEEMHISFAEYSYLEEVLRGDLVPISGIIESLREVKDAGEIAVIKKACSIADLAFDYIIKMIRPGMTEVEVANQLDFYMRSLGATGVSFETIVASGHRSAMPHGVASEKVIGENELVTLDFGCYYQGYVSDITRTIAIGEPAAELKKIYQIVLAAQEKVIQAAQPGVTGRQLDAIARDYIVGEGCGDYFGHATGHGIGLEIHEGPSVSGLADHQLVLGNIITDEPGIYLEGLGGVRIEDDLLIADSGVEVLTHAPKELIIL